MLEQVKISGAVGIQWMHFTDKKDMNLGWWEMERYRLNCVVLTRIYMLKPYQPALLYSVIEFLRLNEVIRVDLI